jgi:hypothetical protein
MERFRYRDEDEAQAHVRKYFENVKEELGRYVAFSNEEFYFHTPMHWKDRTQTVDGSTHVLVYGDVTMVLAVIRRTDYNHSELLIHRFDDKLLEDRIADMKKRHERKDYNNE